MASDKDWPELREQLARSVEKDKHRARVLRAAFLTVVSGAVMVLGIKVIGTAQVFDFDGDQYWDSFRLELGIFVALIGAILVALSLSPLVSALKGLKAA